MGSVGGWGRVLQWLPLVGPPRRPLFSLGAYLFPFEVHDPTPPNHLLSSFPWARNEDGELRAKFRSHPFTPLSLALFDPSSHSPRLTRP